MRTRTVRRTLSAWSSRPRLRRPRGRTSSTPTAARCARPTSPGSSSPPDRAYKVKKPIVLPFLDYGTPERRHRALPRGGGAQPPARPRAVPRRAVAGPGRRRAAARGRGRPARRRLRGRDAPLRRVGDARRAAARGRGRARGRRGRGRAAGRVPRGSRDRPTRRRRRGGQARARRRLRHAAPALRPTARRSRGSSGPPAHSWPRSGTSSTRAPPAGSCATATATCGSSTSCSASASASSTASSSSPALRRIDVAADLAFPLMELHEAARADLADALVRAYRAAGGDPGSDALLAFFAAYRAEVRAKVALLRAEQRGPAAAEPDARACAAAPGAGRPAALAGARAARDRASPACRRRGSPRSPGSSPPCPASPSSTRTWCARPPPGCNRPSARRCALYADDVSRATYAALGAGAAGQRRDRRHRRRDLPAARRSRRVPGRAGARRAGAVDPVVVPAADARAARPSTSRRSRARLGRRGRGRAHPAAHRRAAGRGARCRPRAGAGGPLAGGDPRRDRGRRLAAARAAERLKGLGAACPAPAVRPRPRGRDGSGSGRRDGCPRPGAEVIASSPSTSAIRSRIPTRPKPPAGCSGSKPTPSSQISTSTWPGSASGSVIRSVTLAAAACLTMLVSASCTSR